MPIFRADWTKDAYPEPRIKREGLPGSFELPSLRDQFQHDASSSSQASRPRELLPSILAHSPPGRYASLPPIQRSGKLQRPRKSSVGQNARKPKHERTKSKDFSRRLSVEGRKAMSAEPPTAAWVQGKRWEDLIEAATSATEADDDRDLTPVSTSAFLWDFNSAKFCSFAKDRILASHHVGLMRFKFSLTENRIG
jgi:hypothetical protein